MPTNIPPNSADDKVAVCGGLLAARSRTFMACKLCESVQPSVCKKMSDAVSDMVATFGVDVQQDVLPGEWMPIRSECAKRILSFGRLHLSGCASIDKPVFCRSMCKVYIHGVRMGAAC